MNKSQVTDRCRYLSLSIPPYELSVLRAYTTFIVVALMKRLKMSENGLQLLMLGQRQNILAASDCDEFRKNEQTRNTIERKGLNRERENM